MRFPNPCCRCGFCCLTVTCITAQVFFGIGKHDPCPSLKFEDHQAICVLALENPEPLGVGLGCCIKATAYRKGVAYDFASLPPVVKVLAASQKRLQDWAA
jgi:hypothetical protein